MLTRIADGFCMQLMGERRQIGLQTPSAFAVAACSVVRRISLALAMIFLVLPLVSITGNQAVAIAQMISIDRRITQEELKLVEPYLSGFDMHEVQVFFADFGGVLIARIEGARTCLGGRCLTLVMLRCAENKCDHVKIMAPREVFSSDAYVDVLGGLGSVTFGESGIKTGPGVLFGSNLMIVFGH